MSDYSFKNVLNFFSFEVVSAKEEWSYKITKYESTCIEYQLFQGYFPSRVEHDQIWENIINTKL